VEFALSCSLLLLVLVGIFDVSRALAAYVSLGSASQDGARYVVGDPGSDVTAVTSRVRARAALVDADALAVDVAYYDGAAWRPWTPWPALMTDPLVRSVPVRVEVRYPWSASSLVLSSFLNGQLVTRAVMEAKP
jgi:hypothetical protein